MKARLLFYITSALSPANISGLLVIYSALPNVEEMSFLFSIDGDPDWCKAAWSTHRHLKHLHLELNVEEEQSNVFVVSRPVLLLAMDILSSTESVGDPQRRITIWQGTKFHRQYDAIDNPYPNPDKYTKDFKLRFQRAWADFVTEASLYGMKMPGMAHKRSLESTDYKQWNSECIEKPLLIGDPFALPLPTAYSQHTAHLGNDHFSRWCR